MAWACHGLSCPHPGRQAAAAVVAMAREPHPDDADMQQALPVDVGSYMCRVVATAATIEFTFGIAAEEEEAV